MHPPRTQQGMTVSALHSCSQRKTAPSTITQGEQSRRGANPPTGISFW